MRRRYNRHQVLDKVFTTVKDKHGNKIETGIVKGGEYKTEEGYTIKGGKYTAFQHTNIRRQKYFQMQRHQNELRKLFERYDTLTAMGIAATYNRLRAPLQGPANR